MKIRTGFVSNSSSSSFLLLMKDKSILDKLDSFEETATLKTDLDYNEESVKGFLRGLVFNNLWYVYKSITEEEEMYYLPYSNTGWIDLVVHLDFKDETMEEICMYMREQDNLDWDKFDDIRTKYEDAIDKEIDRLYNFIKDKGYTCGFVRYEDHTEDGNHMEHYFMPFVINIPDKGFKGYRISEH